MTAREARTMLCSILKLFFTTADVVFAKQQNAVKATKPLITITPVSSSRPLNPPTETVDGMPVSYYPTEMTLQIDLFTKGNPISTGDGATTAMENTAMNDMTEFANFLGSEYFLGWSHKKDITLIPTGPVQDTTAIISNASYQFRATLELSFNFVQKAIGYAGILDEASIKHTTEAGTESGDDAAPDTYIEPTYTPSASGGGTEELAKEIIGYFTAAEIKEENADVQ